MTFINVSKVKFFFQIFQKLPKMRNDMLMRNNGAGGWNWRTKMKQQKHTMAMYQVI